MTKNIITGSTGFIGRRLSEKIFGYNLRHFEIRYGHSYLGEKFFFLSTYGNMAHHRSCEVIVKANVQDLITVLNGWNGEWFCYVSSSSVTLPVQTPYSRSKRAGEEILQALPELKSCIVRPYSVTGVGEQKEHLIPTLIRSCMEGEEMPFNPNPVHDFVDVEDVVDGLIALSEQKFTGIIEFGSGKAYTNKEVKEMVEWICSRKANVKEVSSLRSYDNQDWYCKSQHPLWSPKKTLFQSITEMVEAYKHERS